jgi:hypothetical protein
MITIPLHSDPPLWMEAAVSSLLPPACRETVLGDLQERFGERGARARWLGYVGDVVTTVPQFLWSQIRRIVTRGPACAAAVPGDLRIRAEQHQTQVWIRNAVILFSVVISIGVFLLPAVLLILYSLAVAVPRFRGGVLLLGALAMQTCAIAWAHRIERSRYQRELERLDQEGGQA